MDTLLHLMESYGYVSLFVAMAAENANIPVPSEVILGFAGFLISQHVFTFWTAFFIACAGGIAGSVISYGLGLYGGRPLLLKYGKYIFFNEKKFALAEQLFAKYGGIAVVVGRCLPGIRTFISFPAGVARYPFGKFVFFSVIGTIPWTLLLVWAGSLLGSHWHNLVQYNHLFVLIVVLLCLAAGVIFLIKRGLPPAWTRFLYAHRYSLSLAVFSAVIFFSFLGAFPLTDPDEPVYGETAREMLAAKDWLSPRIFGMFWYDKPPLFYWLEMLSYRLFGISDLTSRLPGACMAFATVLYVYYRGKKIFNPAVAYTSAMILASSLGFWYIGHAAITDTALVFTLTVALLGFYEKQYYRAYIFCGLAVLAKGPIGYAFPALIVLLYLLAMRRLRQLREMKLFSGILLALLVGLPWYVLMYHTHGDAFLQTFIGYHNITRFAAPEHPGRNSVFFFIPVLAVGLLPWSAGLIPALVQLRKRAGIYRDALYFCVLWAAFIFIFFSLSKTQLVTYIAPMFPPCALLLGWFFRDRFDAGKRSLSTILSALLPGLLLLGANAFPLHGADVVFRPALHVIATLLGSTLLLAALLWLRPARAKAAFALTVCGMLALALAVNGLLMPPLATTLTSAPLARYVRPPAQPGTEIYIEKFLHPGVTFYSGVYGKEWKTPADLPLSAIQRQPQRVYIVLRKTTWRTLCRTRNEAARFRIVQETATQLIVTNH